MNIYHGLISLVNNEYDSIFVSYVNFVTEITLPIPNARDRNNRGMASKQGGTRLLGLYIGSTRI